MLFNNFFSRPYLLTWNCKQMANAQIQRKLSQISMTWMQSLQTYAKRRQQAAEKS
ncbi:MAG: type II toxin-antitoxin system VapC family toxin [Microcystis aeruginosa LG13-12]|nr:type II toxin-antitoxin system VapC family toxin [Microcystis aeruginosa LG13-12]